MYRCTKNVHPVPPTGMVSVKNLPTLGLGTLREAVVALDGEGKDMTFEEFKKGYIHYLLNKVNQRARTAPQSSQHPCYIPVHLTELSCCGESASILSLADI